MRKNNNMVNLIMLLHDKFNITGIKFTPEEKKFRIAAMEEELQEYIDATTKADELDALIDLLVFTLGTIDRQFGLDILDVAFNRVMAANLSKELGPNNKRGSFALDLVKPVDFIPPKLDDLV